jgi:hypothetical protein
VQRATKAGVKSAAGSDTWMLYQDKTRVTPQCLEYMPDSFMNGQCIPPAAPILAAR